MLKKKVVFLYLDAFSFSYLKYAPFLRELAQKSLYGNVRPGPLHQPEFSIFTGKSQKNIDFFSWFYVNPNKSPYKFLKHSLFLKYIDNGFVRKMIDYYVSFKRFYSGKTNLVSINKIPFEIASKIAYTSDKIVFDKAPLKYPTLFDILRKNNIEYVAHGWPMKFTNGKMSLNPFVKNNKQISNFLIKNKDKEFLFAHFVNLDHVVHEYGLYSKEAIHEIRDLDKQIKKLYRHFNDRIFIILSDHGMVDIVKIIDVLSILKNEDCLFLCDSNMVRVWCKEKNIERIKKKLKIEGGRVFDKKNIEEIGIKYIRKYTGDLLFVVDPGVLILPNHFNGNNAVKAMHGYAFKKNHSELDALLILNSLETSPKRFKDIKDIDVIPSVIKLLGLKIPSIMDGKPTIHR